MERIPLSLGDPTHFGNLLPPDVLTTALKESAEVRECAKGVLSLLRSITRGSIKLVEVDGAVVSSDRALSSDLVCRRLSIVNISASFTLQHLVITLIIPPP